MSYFSAGAWWSSDGKPFATQAEAEQYERFPDEGEDEDAFAAATGRARAATTPAPASGRTGAKTAPAQVAPSAGSRGDRQLALDSQPGFWDDPVGQGLEAASAVYTNPIASPIGFAAKKGGELVDRAVGNVFDRSIDAYAQATVSPRTNVATDLRPSVSGYIQDPIGQFAKDVGAPDLVQAGANPTGFLNRTAVNSGTSYGLNPAAVAQGGIQAGRNIVNDVRNVPGTVAGAAGAVAGAVNGAGGYIGSLVNQAGNQRGVTSGANAATYAPAPLPTPSMTPDQIMGMQTNAVRPSSAQSDAIVQQMLAQSNVQSPQRDFSNAGYDASRGAAMGYTSQLAGLANNNVAVTGLDSGRYDQSRGTVNQITGQLQAQANNNVGDIQANSAQRDASRAGVMNTADALRQTAFNDVQRIDANQSQRLGAQGAMVDVENALTSGRNVVGDIQADQSLYGDSRATSNDIIQRLIAAAERQEGPSAAESLMLNAQERAVRNAYGDAGSLGGGWRSQLTGQRRALGQAATMQADIAAQLGALRANEENAFRDRELAALTGAGGLSGAMGGRDLALAQGDAALLAQIRQGNQANERESQIAAGTLAGQRMVSDTGLAISDADRAILAAQGNQQNRLSAQLGAGQLQTGAMVSDTGLAQSNASLLAQIRQGNQQNSLNSLLGAGNTASNVLSSDLGFATNDAQIRTQRELANQQNALNAMLGAANAANTTAGLDQGIGIADANRRAQVDQNNRANSIAALQNAGVLSSTIRGQDVQLSIADQQALTSRINAAAQLSGSQFATQMDAAMRTQDLNLRQQQFEFLKSQSPREWERWLAAAGSTAGLLGIIL